MRPRRKILIALLAVVLIAVFALWRASRPTGVFAEKYQDKTLHEWIELRVQNPQSPAEVAQNEAAKAATRAIASNHIPELFVVFQSEPLEAKVVRDLDFLPQALHERIFWKVDSSPRMRRVSDAIRALSSLGPDTPGVLPQLEEFTTNRSHAVAVRAYLVIKEFGANALPFLIQSAGDRKNPRSSYAMLALGLLSHDIPAKMLPAIPVLEQGTNSSNSGIAGLSQTALENILKATSATNANAPAAP